MSEPFAFQVLHADGAARQGRLSLPHGTLPTPAFMPVGTQATVKGLTVEQLRATGSRMVLGNTYHLALRPGAGTIEQLGGLHAFMGWDGPILTDSGGFQIFSLADRARISDEGAVFQSHIDGRRIELSPEQAVAIQESLGSDPGGSPVAGRRADDCLGRSLPRRRQPRRPAAAGDRPGRTRPRLATGLRPAADGNGLLRLCRRRAERGRVRGRHVPDA
jgi:hypothetical protein